MSDADDHESMTRGELILVMRLPKWIGASAAVLSMAACNGSGGTNRPDLQTAWKAQDSPTYHYDPDHPSIKHCDVMMSLWGDAQVEAGYSKPTSVLGDDGHTLSLKGLHGDTIDKVLIGCVFRNLRTPSRVSDLVSDTTALVGRQREDANGIEYVWSYHPDNRLDMVISDRTD